MRVRSGMARPPLSADDDRLRPVRRPAIDFGHCEEVQELLADQVATPFPGRRAQGYAGGVSLGANDVGGAHDGAPNGGRSATGLLLSFLPGDLVGPLPEVLVLLHRSLVLPAQEANPHFPLELAGQTGP